MDSSAQLLFRILGDSSQGQADLAQLRAVMSATMGSMVADSKMASSSILYDWSGNPIKQVARDWTDAANSAQVGAARMVGSSGEARQAMRGLGTEIGVRMPRFVSSWLSSMGGVQSVMSAAFMPIAVIGLAEVLAQLPGAIQKITDKIRGWDEEAKKAYAEHTKLALQWQLDSLDIIQRMDAISLIGKEGAEKYNLELALNKKAIGEVADKLDELHVKQAKARATANYTPPPAPDAQTMAGLNLTGEWTGGKSHQTGPSHEEIEKAKSDLKELEGPVAELTNKLRDLTIHQQEISAQASADAAKAKEDFTGLTDVLGRVKERLESLDGPEERVRAEMTQLSAEADKAREKLLGLNREHKLDPAQFAAQLAAWKTVTEMIPELQARMLEELHKKQDAEAARQSGEIKDRELKAGEEFVAAIAKSGEAAHKATVQLQEQLAEDLAKGGGDPAARLDAQIALTRSKLGQIEQLTGAHEAVIESIRQAATASLAARQQDADARKQARIAEVLQRIEEMRQTASSRVSALYAAEVAKSSEAEEAKTLASANGEAQRNAIRLRFANEREALAAREKAELQQVAEAAQALQALAQGAQRENVSDPTAELNARLEKIRESLREEGQLTAENESLLAALRRQGEAKILADKQVAYDQERARLSEQLERIDSAHQTAAERIAAQYQADVAEFSAAEEQKTLTMAVSDAQRAAIHQQFATIRTGLLNREQADLQALHNSTGWQGVFGNQFAQTIRGNEALWREWSTSTQQAHMMVRVSLESLKEMGQQTFGEFAQAEGSAIASSLVYSKSIGAAMREALASTLESISARALVQAIYSAGLGFLCLAEGDFPGAAAAFEAAAIFGTVGAAVGIAGRGVAGKQGAGGGASSGVSTPGPTPGSSSVSQGGGGGGSAAGNGGSHVTINVYGHVIGTSGAGELVSMINEQVVTHDQTLTATNTKTGVQTQQ